MGFTRVAALCVGLLAGATALAAEPEAEPVAINRATRQFLGTVKGDYILPGRPVAEQVAAGMSGPPNAPLVIQPGRVLVSGCRFHSCTEKSAVILVGAEVQAVGLIHYGCRFVGQEAIRERRHIVCSDQPKLTMFVDKKGDRARDLQGLTSWALGVEQRPIVSEVVEVRPAMR